MRLSLSLKKKVTQLKQKKYRDEAGEYVIEGFKMTTEAIADGEDIYFIAVDDSPEMADKNREIISMAEKKSIKIYFAGKSEFAQLSSLETAPGVLAVIKKKKEFVAETKPYLILDSIKDPGNLGTIIRTADWFGFENIVIGDESVDVYNQKTLQSTMGSVFHVNFLQNQNLVEFIGKLKGKGYKIIATSLVGSKDKPELKDKKFAIVMGSESFGLGDEILKLADYSYKIPGFGKAESLNVAVATGIMLYDFSSNR